MTCAQAISEDEVWSWCFDAYLLEGIRLRFPKSSDYTKTYQWRYVKAITKKFNEWNLNEESCKKFISVAVEFARRKRVLRKGLSVLHQKNIMQLCYDEMILEIESLDNKNMALIKCCDQYSSLGFSSFSSYLKSKVNPRALSNLTSLFLARKMPLEFMSLNKVTMECYKTLDDSEKALLPSLAQLYICRKRMLDGSFDQEIIKRVINFH